MTFLKTPSLYFDEDVSVKIAANLRLRGFDVRTTQEAKNMGATDEEQLGYAVATARALVTHNIRHFTRLHALYLSGGKTHFGIILAVRRRNPSTTVVRLLGLLQTALPEGMRNQIRYV